MNPGVSLIVLAAVLTAGRAKADVSEQRVSAAVVFALADAARAQGDNRAAEAAYRALTADERPPIRNEARFRLGRMLASEKRPAEAALLYRAILDEEPGAARVRLELAAVLDAMGDETGARKALREAQAGGLPPEVARFVDRYAAALRARKRFGISADLAVAPDSNISRSTSSDTIGTVLGDLELSEDARARSGIGLTFAAQLFIRTKAEGRANIIARGGVNASLYRDSRFNDIGAIATIGPELRFGDERLAIEGGVAGRRYGGTPYSSAGTLTVTWLHPLGRLAQLRTIAAFAIVDNRWNDSQDGETYAISASWERALSPRAGIGASLALDRQALRDPGWSTTGGLASVFGYRDLGRTTVLLALDYGRLEADARLALFPERRMDDLLRARAVFSARQLGFGRFAPLLRLTAERNRSTIEIYDYRRLRMEIGISRAF